jgi:hypothetical protein
MTECSQETFGFQDHKSRAVQARFDGGHVTSDGGLLLLRELERRSGTMARFAQCFKDHRNPTLIEHTVEELVSQRILGLACGYEDLNDHDTLRLDPAFALAVGKRDIEGKHRPREEDRGKPLAGKSTLNRLELTKRIVPDDERYRKIGCDEKKVGEFFIDECVRAKAGRKVRRLILDLDCTGYALHGDQEGKHFLAYYDEYVYQPLYIFDGDMPLVVRLQTGDRASWYGVTAELSSLIPRLRGRYPGVQIIVRGDSAFGQEEIMAFCEENRVDYILGLKKNERLEKLLADAMKEAQSEFAKTGEVARRFDEFQYRTLNSWSRERRVIGKAEYMAQGENPRFVVTSLSRKAGRAMRMYEEWYCQRCDMENRIKEQLQLFADRMSVEVKRANQLRLWFSAVAYILLANLRRLALRGTELARAEAATIRLRLLKIGAQLLISCRRVFFSLASAFPLQNVFATAHRNLMRV